MKVQFTPDLIPLAGVDVFVMTFRARGAAGYVCFGKAMPNGTFYSKRIGDVEYAVEVAHAADAMGRDIEPADNFTQAQFIYYTVTPIKAQGDPEAIAELQEALKAQLELMLANDQMPSFSHSTL